MKKLNELLQHCHDTGFQISDFNTNNGWGFGGAYGLIAENDKYIIKEAKACYRHLPPYKFITLTEKGGSEILDLADTKKNRLKVLNYLKERDEKRV